MSATFAVPTRRDLIESGGAVAAAGLAAGCAGRGGESAGGTTRTGTGSGGSHTVEMAPVGKVTLDAVPESVAFYFPGYADMAVALGRGDAVDAIGKADRYHTDVYGELGGASVDEGSLTQLITENGIDKEVFYELGSDLHFVDPNWLTQNSFFGLTEADVRELSKNVAPFLGNVVFRRTDEWHDYRYYTMYEAFGKVAAVFGERGRYEAFRRLHDEYVGRVQSKLPPADDRPNALLCFASGDRPERFSPYRLTDRGTNKKQFHDLGIADALAGTGIQGLSTNDRGQIDYETMLEVDPDSLLVRGHETKTRREFRDSVVAFMKNHDTASELTAVREGRVFRGGPIYAGPIHNLFLTERLSKAFFPDRFSGKLFDRSRVSAVVRGEV